MVPAIPENTERIIGVFKAKSFPGFSHLFLLPVVLCTAMAIWQMSYDWIHDETYHYGWTVLPLALYLFSIRWRDRPVPGPPLSARWIGGSWIIIALSILPVWLIREANPDWRLVGLAFACIAVATALLTISEIGGSAWLRHFAGPVLFFLVSIPWPTFFENFTTSILMPANAAITLEVLHWLQVPAIRSGHLITLPGGTLGVEEACSGVRSLQSTIMMSFFLGELNDLRRKHRLVLFLVGASLALFTNILRTIGLSAMAAWHGLDAANRWHDQAGLLALAANTLGLFLLAAFLVRRSARLHPKKASASKITTNDRPRSMVPTWSTDRWSFAKHPSGFLYLAIALMFPITSWWYGRHESAPSTPWIFTPPVSASGFRMLPLGEKTSSLLRHPDGWNAKWNSPTGQPMQAFYLDWKSGKIPPEIMSTHGPGTCLGTLGITPDEEFAPLPIKLPDRVGHARFLRFLDDDRPLYLLYFVWENQGRRASDHPEMENYTQSFRVDAVLRGQRNTGQQFIEIGLWDASSESEARATFQELINQNIVSSL